MMVESEKKKNLWSTYRGSMMGIIAGAAACLGSVFGKIGGGNTLVPLFQLLHIPKLVILGKIFAFGLLILCNTINGVYFAKAMDLTSSIHATVITTAVNFSLSSVIGFLFFSEKTTLFFWTGLSLIITGVLVIAKSSPENESVKDDADLYEQKHH